MNKNTLTGTTLAADILDRLIQLDALLGHADRDDKVELQERITAVDPAEFKNILATFRVKSAPLSLETAPAATVETVKE